MKNVIITIIIMILIVAVVFFGYKYLSIKDNINNSNNTQSEVINNDNNSFVNDEESNTSSDEDNTTIYIGTENNFEEYKVNIDKSTDVMEQAKQIVEKIGKNIGYNILET